MTRSTTLQQQQQQQQAAALSSRQVSGGGVSQPLLVSTGGGGAGDDDKVVLTGSGLQTARVNEHAEFTIDGTNAGYGARHTRHGTGSLGHRVSGSFGSSFTSGSPGHHFDTV